MKNKFSLTLVSAGVQGSAVRGDATVAGDGAGARHGSTVAAKIEIITLKLTFNSPKNTEVKLKLFYSINGDWYFNFKDFSIN